MWYERMKLSGVRGNYVLGTAEYQIIEVGSYDIQGEYELPGLTICSRNMAE